MKLGKTAFSGAALLLVVLAGLGDASEGDTGSEPIEISAAGSWALASDMRSDPAPTQPVTLEIRGVGTFAVDPATIATWRPDLFDRGRFSAFDVLAQLAAAGDIELAYAYDETQATHVIESLGGLDGWWYDVRLSGGAWERTALRMDTYPIKDGASVTLYLEDPARLAAIQSSFREEVRLLAAHEGRVVVPVVTIEGPRSTATFRDVVVTSHDVRPDVFQPGTITALDVLLSLGEQSWISGLEMTWHASLDGISNVNHYMVDWISIPEALGEEDSQCGYMDESATGTLRSFLTPHSHATTQIHLSPDLEILVSPGYVEWQWLCAAS